MPTPPLTLAAIRQPGFLYDADGRIAEANQQAEALAGRPLAGCSLADAIDIFDPRHPDGTSLAPSDLPACRALAGGVAIDVPFTVTASDGLTLHVLATASPLREGDRIVGALSIWQDVSSLEAARAGAEKAAAELGAREEKLRQTTAALAVEKNELERQRGLLDAILGILPYRVTLWDRDQRLVWVNDGVTAERGWPRESVLGRSGHDLGFDMAVAEHLSGDILRSIAAGRTYSNEFEVATPGGAVWRAITLLPIFGDSVLAITGDVTERHRAGDALRESEERLRLAQENAEIGIWDRDVTTGRVTISPEFLRRAGLEGIVIASYEDWARLIHPDDRERVEAERQRAFAAGEPLDLEFRVVIPSGETQWIQFKGREVMDRQGAPSREIGVFINVTARKEVEEALCRSEERLRLAQESANIAVWDWDVRTGLYTSTPEFFRLYGCEEGPTLPYAQWRDLVHPDDITWVEAESQAALARGEPFDLEHRIVRPSGEIRWLQTIARGITDEQGEVVRVLGVNMDITARKTAELALARSAEEMERSNEELQRFAYVASHDLQEPLRSIVSFSQLLERRYKGKLDTDADEFITFIVEGGARMQQLIMDLLQLSRVETKAKPLVPTDAGEVVADALRLLETPIREAGATITVGDMPVVMADAAQLAQVFTNLVSNALKYRRPDVPPEVRISAERAGKFWRFSVADNGIGIEAEYFDRIFVIFQRLHTREEYAGTGIGLAVVRKIVERHGGRVGVESTLGQGSTFFFTLPAG